MYDTAFNPQTALRPRIAATANCPIRRRVLLGEVHDSNAWAMGGISGNAGLFSTVLDLALFANMLLSGGVGVLSFTSVQLMFQNLINPSIGSHTAGWFIYPNEMLPFDVFPSKQTIGHTGFTGTSVLIDACYDTYVILLTNRVCHADNSADFRKIRRIFHNAILQVMLSS
jgi:CubicO group peptidase (beta-lactamase class C family)